MNTSDGHVLLVKMAICLTLLLGEKNFAEYLF